MKSSPPVGAIAYGKSGLAYEVLEVMPDRIRLKNESGETIARISAILRWEPPVQRYKLKGSGKIYTLVESHEVNVCGTIETWGKFLDPTGLLCHWAMSQMEPTSEGEVPGVDGLRRRLEFLYRKPTPHPLSYGLCTCGQFFDVPGLDHSLCASCGWMKSG
jgi:hypothetical protein